MKLAKQVPSIAHIGLGGLTLLGTVLLSSSQAIAISSFTGVYDSSNWVTTRTGDSSGPVTQNTNTLEIQLDSGSAGTYIERTIDIDASRAGTIQFEWSLASSEIADIQQAGYRLNGVYTDLGNNIDGIFSGLSPVQVVVNDGDVFGFRFLALDNTTSTGIFTVNNFEFTPTPVPLESDALPIFLSAGFLGGGMWVKRKLKGNKG